MPGRTDITSLQPCLQIWASGFAISVQAGAHIFDLSVPIWARASAEDMHMHGPDRLNHAPQALAGDATTWTLLLKKARKCPKHSTKSLRPKPMRRCRAP